MHQTTSFGNMSYIFWFLIKKKTLRFWRSSSKQSLQWLWGCSQLRKFNFSWGATHSHCFTIEFQGLAVGTNFRHSPDLNTFTIIIDWAVPECHAIIFTFLLWFLGRLSLGIISWSRKPVFTLLLWFLCTPSFLTFSFSSKSGFALLW